MLSSAFVTQNISYGGTFYSQADCTPFSQRRHFKWPHVNGYIWKHGVQVTDSYVAVTVLEGTDAPRNQGVGMADPV